MCLHYVLQVLDEWEDHILSQSLSGSTIERSSLPTAFSIGDGVPASMLTQIEAAT